MAKKDTSLEHLNTRDLLLLCQLLEQHGPDAMDRVHADFTTHPAFLLSHNELNDDEIHLTQRQLQSLVESLSSEYPDMTPIQLCEHFYAKRIEELTNQIAKTGKEFGQLRDVRSKPS